MSGRTLGEDRTVVQPVGEGPLESVMTNVEKGNGSSRERTGRRSEMASVDGERDSEYKGQVKDGDERKESSMDSIMATIAQQNETILRELQMSRQKNEMILREVRTSQTQLDR